MNACLVSLALFLQVFLRYLYEVRWSMDPEAIRRKLVAVFATDGRDVGECRDIAFRLTDWIEDLEPMVAVYQAPEASENEAVAKVVMEFLIHASNHLAAASKLALGIPVTDIFHVGATTEDPDNESGA